jgi:hypothetical protein
MVSGSRTGEMSGAVEVSMPARMTQARRHRKPEHTLVDDEVEYRRKAVCGGGEWWWSPRCRLLTVSVNLPFTLFTSRSSSTHVDCLLATCFLGQRHCCVATMFVYVTQTFPAYHNTSCRKGFVGIAPNGPCCSSCGTCSRLCVFHI